MSNLQCPYAQFLADVFNLLEILIGVEIRSTEAAVREGSILAPRPRLQGQAQRYVV